MGGSYKVNKKMQKGRKVRFLTKKFAQNNNVITIIRGKVFIKRKRTLLRVNLQINPQRFVDVSEVGGFIDCDYNFILKIILKERGAGFTIVKASFKIKICLFSDRK